MRHLVLIAIAANATVGQPLPKGFEHFYNLEYADAIREFQASIAQDPSNANPQNHLAQAVLYREMFKAGALESELVSGTNPFLRREKITASPEATASFMAAIDTSMRLSQAAIDKNPRDASALYTLGVAHGLRANYNFLVQKQWMASLKDATAARKLHNKVVELDPKMIDARLIEGVHDYVVGSLPWHYKMLGFLAGMGGDREEGMRTLKLVAEKGNLNRYDAQVLLAAIYRRERKPVEAIPLLTKLVSRFPRNYLFRLEAVQMHSDAGDKDQALASLQEIEKLKKAGSPGFTALSLEKIFYYRGNLLFWYKDLDSAADELRRASSRTNALDPHTAVMTWLRLGQTLDMKGQRKDAIDSYRKAIAIAPQSDAAKESKRYVSSPYKRS